MIASVRVVLSRSLECTTYMTWVAVLLKVVRGVPMIHQWRGTARPVVTAAAKPAHPRTRDDREPAHLDDGFHRSRTAYARREEARAATSQASSSTRSSRCSPSGHEMPKKNPGPRAPAVHRMGRTRCPGAPVTDRRHQPRACEPRGCSRSVSSRSISIAWPTSCSIRSRIAAALALQYETRVPCM
jgi:hypothetical protein